MVRQPLGQHFLQSTGVLDSIVQAAGLSETDSDLEIGPGKGALTDRLLKQAGRIVCIELDRGLAAQLRARYRDQPHLEIIEGDFLKFDFSALVARTRHYKVMGNIPYAITSPIFQKLFQWDGWTIGVFLIQKEVGDRMMAPHGSKQFGVLSLATQLYVEVEKIRLVPPGAFKPPPEVMSVVLRLIKHPQRRLAQELEPSFFDFVHGAFAHRRKTIANSLSFHVQKPTAELQAWLTNHGVNPQARAESLAFSDFLRLAEPWSIYRRGF